MGTLHIHPQVITLYAQYYPGKPGIWGRRYDRDNVVPDTAVIRETAFKTCLCGLGKLMRSKGLTHVAMPYKIGCGLAGCDWIRYQAMIQDWLAENIDLHVVIYKFP